MKKVMKQGAIALAGIACTASALAQSGVTIAGRVDVGPQYIDNGTDKLKRVDSGTYTASRLIFRGVEDLGDGLKAGFYLENRFNADFLDALRTQFVLRIGGAVYFASRESRGHSDPNISSTLYGPKITFCPFCGTTL